MIPLVIHRRRRTKFFNVIKLIYLHCIWHLFSLSALKTLILLILFWDLHKSIFKKVCNINGENTQKGLKSLAKNNQMRKMGLSEKECLGANLDKKKLDEMDGKGKYRK